MGSRVVTNLKIENDPKTSMAEAELLNEYEQKRAARIALRDAELRKLGIPTLVGHIIATATEAKTKKAKPKKPKKPTTTTKQQRPATIRRSSRLLEASQKPKEETTEQKYRRELGEAIVNEQCPLCHAVLLKGHAAHLQSCTGERKRKPPSVSKREAEEFSELTEEERRDSHKRMMVRMKALELAGLISCDQDEAVFQVQGSKGTPYIVKLNDDKHRCTCLDHRFRRHNCKHICLVLQQLGILDDGADGGGKRHPQEAWRAAVHDRLDQLLANQHDQDEEEEKEVKGDGKEKPKKKMIKIVKEEDVPNEDADIAAKFL